MPEGALFRGLSAALVPRGAPNGTEKNVKGANDEQNREVKDPDDEID